MDLIVLAKEPIPGRVKTRLSPPCSARQAATLAAAALADTLAAALATGADRVLLALDGESGPWVPDGVEVVSQGTGSFADRLGCAWSHTAGPALQIGMDTPQVSADRLRAAADPLVNGTADAVLGLAEDGGWWALGLRRPDRRVFAGVPTSQPDTGPRQHRQLRKLGLRTTLLPTVRDVDTYEDAVAVAATAPTTKFAACLASMEIAAT